MTTGTCGVNILHFISVNEHAAILIILFKFVSNYFVETCEEESGVEQTSSACPASFRVVNILSVYN